MDEIIVRNFVACVNGGLCRVENDTLKTCTNLTKRGSMEIQNGKVIPFQEGMCLIIGRHRLDQSRSNLSDCRFAELITGL